MQKHRFSSIRVINLSHIKYSIARQKFSFLSSCRIQFGPKKGNAKMQKGEYSKKYAGKFM